jgi:hypothetical protein
LFKVAGEDEDIRERRKKKERSNVPLAWLKELRVHPMTILV